METAREGGLGVRDYRRGSGATLGISGTSDTNHDHENNDKSTCLTMDTYCWTQFNTVLRI